MTITRRIKSKIQKTGFSLQEATKIIAIILGPLFLFPPTLGGIGTPSVTMIFLAALVVMAVLRADEREQRHPNDCPTDRDLRILMVSTALLFIIGTLSIIGTPNAQSHALAGWTAVSILGPSLILLLTGMTGRYLRSKLESYST